jgi:hypothetical protein
MIFKITKEQYNYLLPVYGIGAGNKSGIIREQNGAYLFFGSYTEFVYLNRRCAYL